MNAPLSIWSAYYIDLSPEDAVLEFKKYGIFASELSDEHGLALLQRGEPEATGAAFKAFLKKEGFTMTQGHLWLSCKICTTENAVEMLFQWLRLYEAIGIENAVLHCDCTGISETYTQENLNEINLQKLTELQALIKDMRIRVCLENLCAAYNSSESLVWLTDRLDQEHFGICLDTGHLNMCTQSQEDFILHAGSRLHALHIADNEGERDQHMMPFGRGNVDFESVVRALRKVNYAGLFNLEIPGERLAPLEVRGYKLEYIRKCYDYLMQIP